MSRCVRRFLGSLWARWSCPIWSPGHVFSFSCEDVFSLFAHVSDDREFDEVAESRVWKLHAPLGLEVKFGPPSLREDAEGVRGVALRQKEKSTKKSRRSGGGLPRRLIGLKVQVGPPRLREGRVR
jgi:hypothetical protein